MIYHFGESKTAKEMVEKSNILSRTILKCAVKRRGKVKFVFGEG